MTLRAFPFEFLVHVLASSRAKLATPAFGPGTQVGEDRVLPASWTPPAVVDPFGLGAPDMTVSAANLERPL
jgi:hypothetical protein